jgi:hypothetical protein
MIARAMGVAAALVLAAACRTSGTAQAPASGTQQPPATAGRAGTGGQDPLMEPGPTIKGHASDQVVSGEILEVSGNSLTIDAQAGAARVLDVAPETSITVDGQEATLADLEEGQPVRASFNEVAGRDVAVEIRAAAPPSPPASPVEPAVPPIPEPATPPGTESPSGATPGDTSGGTGSTGDVPGSSGTGTGSTGDVPGSATPRQW